MLTIGIVAWTLVLIAGIATLVILSRLRPRTQRRPRARDLAPAHIQAQRIRLAIAKRIRKGQARIRWWYCMQVGQQLAQRRQQALARYKQWNWQDYIKPRHPLTVR